MNTKSYNAGVATRNAVVAASSTVGRSTAGVGIAISSFFRGLARKPVLVAGKHVAKR